MIRDKNKKFIFWLIGFGCGMVLSGIIAILYSLNTKEYRQDFTSTLTTQPSKQIELREDTEQKQQQTLQTSETTDAIDTTTKPIMTTKETQSDTITVYIPKGISATEICSLLQEKDVIANANEFFEYVKEMNKTKRLKYGEIIFPRNANYEVVLYHLSLK